MNELADREGAAFAAIDDALRAYPLAPPPPTLAPKVMVRIHALSPTPRFRLACIDYALSLFGAGMAGLGVLFWQAIPPETIALAEVEFVITLQQAMPRIGMAALAGGIVLAICALAFAAVMFEATCNLFKSPT